MKKGTFGLEEEVLILKSGVRDIFTPHTPVDEISHFFGREEEASRLVSVINSPGQHILVYGDRGVGKTSLAKTTCKLILQQLQRGHLFEKRCDSSDSFATLFIDPLVEAGVEVSLVEEEKTVKRGGGAKISAGFAGADLSSDSQVRTKHSIQQTLYSPSWVASRLRTLKGICLIDEVDAIKKDTDKKKVAELIKLLSDSKSPFKLVVVGIAATGEELTSGHRSVERCLKEVALQRMDEDGLRAIILNGFNKLNLRPEDEVVNKIVNISDGYPHFTHLICLKCAEYALTNKQRHITVETLKAALNEAVKDSEGALKRMFDKTMRSLNKPQEYKLILLAAAYCRSPEFRSSELRKKLESKFNVVVESHVLSRRLTNLTRGDSVTILDKPARGCFQFTDPRMASFIKMALNSDDVDLK